MMTVMMMMTMMMMMMMMTIDDDDDDIEYMMMMTMNMMIASNMSFTQWVQRWYSSRPHHISTCPPKTQWANELSCKAISFEHQPFRGNTKNITWPLGLFFEKPSYHSWKIDRWNTRHTKLHESIKSYLFSYHDFCSIHGGVFLKKEDVLLRKLCLTLRLPHCHNSQSGSLKVFLNNQTKWRIPGTNLLVDWMAYFPKMVVHSLVFRNQRNVICLHLG